MAHVFGITIVFAFILYPLYSSAVLDKCGKQPGVAGKYLPNEYHALASVYLDVNTSAIPKYFLAKSGAIWKHCKMLEVRDHMGFATYD